MTTHITENRLQTRDATIIMIEIDDQDVVRANLTIEDKTLISFIDKGESMGISKLPLSDKLLKLHTIMRRIEEANNEHRPDGTVGDLDKS